MKPSFLVVLLTLMNLLLLAATALLTARLRARDEGDELARCREVAQERAQLEAERTRLHLSLERLAGTLNGLQKSNLISPGVKDAVASDPTSIPGIEGLNAIVDDPSLADRPKPLEIGLLDPQEFEALERAAATVPLLSRHTLLTGDIETVLADQEWNPSGKELQDLSPEEIAELLRLLDAFRFYESVAPFERLRDLALPQVEGMRSAGAYVEYPKDQNPPVVPEARLTHAEPSERPGWMRLYYFYPEDNPKLYHHDVVCRQQGLQTALKIHEMLGGQSLSP